jgi:glycine/D-amino acid oxidase-like deaminating enzyme
MAATAPDPDWHTNAIALLTSTGCLKADTILVTSGAWLSERYRTATYGCAWLRPVFCHVLWLVLTGGAYRPHLHYRSQTEPDVEALWTDRIAEVVEILPWL